MANHVIRFYPRQDPEEARSCKIERLVVSAWKLAHCALWLHQSFNAQEEQEAISHIYDYFSAASDLKRAFTAFVQRIVLTQKYTIKSSTGFPPAPAVWFNHNYPFGFASSLSVLHSVDRQREQVPGYLGHISLFAREYYKFSVGPQGAGFQRCRQKLIKQKAWSLLQLFYNTVIYIDYLRA